MRCPVLLALTRVLFLAGLASPAAAQTSRLDSLRQLPRWSAAEQCRLSRQRFIAYARPQQTRQAVAEAEALLAAGSPGLNATARLELLDNLASYYIHLQQPNLAIARLLEVRQRAWRDSARSAVAATWLSYCYADLEQARPALAYGQEALHRLPPHIANYLSERGQALYMVANAAELLHQYALQISCYRQSMVLSRRARDPYQIAGDYTALGAVQLQQGHLPQAAHLLDSARMALGGRDEPGTQFELEKLAAGLALARRQYRQAERVLQPALRRARTRRELIWETEVWNLLVPALAGQRRYREALAGQQRLRTLERATFQQQAHRQAQELEVRYSTAAREQALTRQRQRLTLLQAQQAQRTAEYGRRLAWLLLAGLLTLLLTGLGVVAWGRRQRRLRAAHDERLRQRLAADLHDEVGTLLTRVSLQAEVLGSEQPTLEPAVQRLQANTRAAARTMRDVVWGLDPQADVLTSLVDRMREFLDQTTAPAGLHAELHAEGWLADELLPPIERQQVFLVFKEAVTNAVRHARQASTVQATLRRNSTGLHLRVADDGLRPTVPAPASTGLGLRSMRRRAEQVRGTLSAGWQPGRGYVVELHVPLP